MSMMSMIWREDMIGSTFPHAQAHIFVLEAVEDLDLPQCALAVGLVLKRTYLFDCHLLLCFTVKCRAVSVCKSHWSHFKST